MVDDAAEEALEGGNSAFGVVRVGATVRKPWLPTTPRVHELMVALRSAGIDVPEPRGRDRAGRQVLEHVPGHLAMGGPPLSLAELGLVGSLVRQLHDAAEPVAVGPEPWPVLLPPPEDDTGARLLCHNDLAPWNLVLGERWVFIDWDGAGPSTRSWDLAYAAQTFTLNDPDVAPAVAAGRLAALVAGYDPDPQLRAALTDAIVARPAAMRDHLAAAAASGWEPWASMHRDGHGEHWSRAAEHVREHRGVWRAALLVPSTEQGAGRDSV
ncbi:phosphotransferase [Salana multivorans]